MGFFGTGNSNLSILQVDGRFDSASRFDYYHWVDTAPEDEDWPLRRALESLLGYQEENDSFEIDWRGSGGGRYIPSGASATFGKLESVEIDSELESLAEEALSYEEEGRVVLEAPYEEAAKISEWVIQEHEKDINLAMVNWSPKKAYNEDPGERIDLLIRPSNTLRVDEYNPGRMEYVKDFMRL